MGHTVHHLTVEEEEEEEEEGEEDKERDWCAQDKLTVNQGASHRFQRNIGPQRDRVLRDFTKREREGEREREREMEGNIERYRW